MSKKDSIRAKDERALMAALLPTHLAQEGASSKERGGRFNRCAAHAVQAAEALARARVGSAVGPSREPPVLPPVWALVSRGEIAGTTIEPEEVLRWRDEIASRKGTDVIVRLGAVAFVPFTGSVV